MIDAVRGFSQGSAFGFEPTDAEPRLGKQPMGVFAGQVSRQVSWGWNYGA